MDEEAEALKETFDLEKEMVNVTMFEQNPDVIFFSVCPFRLKVCVCVCVDPRGRPKR